MKTDKDGLRGRGRALEADHFQKLDRKRIERLRAKEEREAARQRLSREGGIDDETSDVLLDVGIGAEELPALDWIPLVEVAWSDGDVDMPEREAILGAVESDGIAQGHPAHDLLLSWLEARPAPELLQAWQRHLSSTDRSAEQRSEILDRARAVAQASGGVLGIGKVSGAESKSLETIETLLG
jgi:hypothetical protein